MRKPLIIALVAVLLVGAGGYFALNIGVDYFARRQIAAMFADLDANGVKAESGEASYDVFSGRFEIKDLSFSAPGQGTLKVGSLLATDVERPSPYRIFAKQVELHDLAYDGPLPLAPAVTSSYRAPLITIRALEVPSVRPEGTRPWQMALALAEQTTADTITIPASLMTTRAGSGDTERDTDVNHGTVVFERLLKGRIAKASAEPSTFAVGGAPANAAKGSVGRIDVETIDIAAILTLLDPESRQAASDFRTVYGMVKVDGYSIETESGIKQSWGSLDIRDVAIKPSAIPAEQLFELGARLQQAGSARLPPELEAQLLRYVATTYDGLKIGSIAFHGLSGREPDGSTAELAALTAGPLDDGKLESLALEKLSGRDSTGKALRLDLLRIGNFRPGTLMEVAADAAEDPSSTRAFGWFMRLFGILDSLTVEGGEGPAPEGGEPVMVDKLAMSWSGETDAIPTQLSATLRLSGPTSAFRDDGPLFALVPDGMKRASLALDVAGKWDEASNTLTFSPLYAEVSDAFALALNVKLKSVDDALFSPQPDEALAGAMAASLESIEITATDAGIYQRKLDEAAKEQGLDPASVRDLLAGFAELLFSSTLSDRPELEPAAQAFVGFLQHPLGTLSLRITPRGPDDLPILMIIETLQGDEPFDLIDELEVTVIDPIDPPGTPTSAPRAKP